jgi:hypothetical protein
MNESTEPNRQDFLWKVILRYDTYYGAINTKASVLIAFNAFVVASLALKWSDMATWFQAGLDRALAGSFLWLAVAASLVSFWNAIRVISPFLRSPQSVSKYHSSVFFEHVAEYKNGEDYLEEIEKMKPETILREYAFQAHVLAQGLSQKFARFKIAVWPVLFIQIPALALLLLDIAWHMTEKFKFTP